MNERDSSGSQGGEASSEAPAGEPPAKTEAKTEAKSATTSATTPAAPPRRKAFLTYALVAAGVATAVVAIAAQRSPGAARPQVAHPPLVTVTPTVGPPVTLPAVAPAPRPRVELVFALDTTSSMSGLIEGAKRKIWSLASFVAQGQPSPDLRVGLVAYRDVGDAYVTRVHDLDDDLDRVYARLRRLRAEGGGDTPEHVARALSEAVDKMSWSDQQGAVKIIYLVGDAPPHDDYDDGYDLKKATRAAVAAGIAVHTIRCGEDAQTESVWRKIASLGRGQFMSVQQDGGMHDVQTPFDDELARLHDRLSGTTIAYGAGAAGVRAAMASAASAPREVKAERVRYLSARKRAVSGGGDLVDDVVRGVVAPAALSPSAMPPELAGLDSAGVSAAIATRAKERREISQRIDELTRQREEHLAKQAKAAAKAGEREGFDDVAKAALRKSVADTAGAGFEL
jgi:hypothetical protein